MLPELNRRGIAPIGMKSLGGDARGVKAKVVSPQEALELRDEPARGDGRQRHGLSRVLKQNVAVARGFKPMSARARATLAQERVEEYAVDGRFELYKISAAFEGVETRRVHGLPSQAELPVIRNAEC